MHILYIHQYFCTRNGKSGTRSYEFASRWVRAGHQVTMVTSAHAYSDLDTSGVGLYQHQHIDGIDVVVVGGNYSQRMNKMQRIATFFRFMVLASRYVLRRANYDVVFATSTPLTVGVPGVLAKWRHRIPLVFEVRDLWPEAPIQMGAVRNRVFVAALRGLERWIYKHSTHVVALSPGMRDGVVRAGKAARDVSVVPNCADLDLFRPDAGDPEFRRRHGIDGRFVVIHAGAMGLVNNLNYVLDAAAIAKQRGSDDIVFVLLGDGSQRIELQDRVRNDNLDNVVFVPPVRRAEVPGAVASSDVCLMMVAPIPVFATASPNKLFDALASGTPTVINCPGWMAEMLQAHDAGSSVDGTVPAQLVDALENLRDDAALRERQGRNARALAARLFDREELARDVLDVLAQAAARRPITPVVLDLVPRVTPRESTPARQAEPVVSA